MPVEIESVAFVGSFTTARHTSVLQGRICSDSCAATLGQKLQIKLAISPSHSMLTTSHGADPIALGSRLGSHLIISV